MGEHVARTTPTKKKRSNVFWNIVGVVGELLITFAFVIGLFSVWQLYWTTYQVSGQVSQTIASYEDSHQPAKRTQGEIRTDDPPAFDREVGDGEVYRRTYGNNFRWIDRLTQGDKVVVEVDDRYLVYSMVSSEIIDATDPTQMRVVAPVIDDESWSEVPTERWMTMTTCHPEYGNWQRYTAELVDEPTN